MAPVATAQGISRTTAYEWWARWRAGRPGRAAGPQQCAPGAVPGLAVRARGSHRRDAAPPRLGAAPDCLGIGATPLDDLRRAAPPGAQPPDGPGPHHAAPDPLCARPPGRAGALSISNRWDAFPRVGASGWIPAGPPPRPAINRPPGAGSD